MFLTKAFILLFAMSGIAEVKAALTSSETTETSFETTETSSATTDTSSTSTSSACSTEYHSTNGTIIHPLHGCNYSNYENCTWTIHTDYPIIVFWRFNTEFSFDFLYIRNGTDDSSPLIGNYSGHQLPPPVQGSFDGIFLRFTSDYSINDTGFALQFTNCGGIYYTSSGQIQHPTNGGFYSNYEDCIWIIYTDDPYVITFQSFNIEYDYDFLYIRNGNSFTSRLIGNFTGNDLPGPVWGSSYAIFLQFTSDAIEVETGFNLTWSPWESVDWCEGWNGTCFGTQEDLAAYNKCDSLIKNATGCNGQTCCVECSRLNDVCDSEWPGSISKSNPCPTCERELGEIRPGSGCTCCQRCRSTILCKKGNGVGARCISEADPKWNVTWCETRRDFQILEDGCTGDGCFCCRYTKSPQSSDDEDY